MQVEELVNEGLRREFKVTVPVAELDAKLNNILEDFRKTTVIKGFRKGKAPLSLLKKMHGERAMGQVLNETVQETSTQLMQDRELKPAMQPELDLEGEFESGKDLAYTMKMDVLPDIDVSDFKAPALERWVAPVDDAQVDAAMERLTEGRKSFRKAAKTAKAKKGDAVFIDYVGRVDGEAFEGGSAEGYELELGSNSFIPGFEDGLIGSKAGEEKDVEVTFPEEYHADNLAGKAAVFSVTVHEVRRPADVTIDDDFAKGLGLEDLEQLKTMLMSQLEENNKGLSRSYMKRSLLDILAGDFSFEVPSRMVELEFQQIWEQIKRDSIASGEAKPEDYEGEDVLEGDEAKEFRGIAERRVRLGLLLSEIGTANGVDVTREEIDRRVIEEARRYPGQEQQVFEFYQKNEEARMQLRAPIFEEKVVDYIIEQADVTEKEVKLDELESALRSLDELEG